MKARGYQPRRETGDAPSTRSSPIARKQLYAVVEAYSREYAATSEKEAVPQDRHHEGAANQLPPKLARFEPRCLRYFTASMLDDDSDAEAGDGDDENPLSRLSGMILV